MMKSWFSKSNSQVGKSCCFEIELLEDKIMLSTVDIYAAGATGHEQMQLLIDNQVAATWSYVGGDYGEREFEKFRFESDRALSADQIGVRFSNDDWDPVNGYDRNLFIDKIVVDAKVYHAEHASVYVTEYWNNGIQSGNLKTETLNVNGEFRFNATAEQNYQRLYVSASGSTGNEYLDVLVGDRVIATVFVSQQSETYKIDYSDGMDLESLKIRFSNDAYLPEVGYDQNLTVESIELVDLETGENQYVSMIQYSVYSTGTWRAEDGVVAGFGRGNTLHSNGYFSFIGFEDRLISGQRNNITTKLFDAGATETEMPRWNDYKPMYGGDGFGNDMINDVDRANPRDISNQLVTADNLIVSSDNLSDFVWLWGQFLDHDIDLSTTEKGASINGSTKIEINDPNDPLGPRPINFTRSNFEIDDHGYRRQINEITSFIDASNVYGSDDLRASALRTYQGGKLKTNSSNLLPTDIDVPNEDGGIGSPNLFVAGDVRANENVALASIHTLFVREHNRLAEIIGNQNPKASDEEIYQLARKIVGAQMQIITYQEFLPALLGEFAPNPDSFTYNPSVDPSIVNEFAHAAYRFGHSMLSPSLQLTRPDGQIVGAIPLKDAFFNPEFLLEDPGRLDLILQGTLNQRAQEIDSHIVEDVRSFLFGPPGAGGLDLASLNIQRGRDHGIPDYNTLREIYGLGRVGSFAEITSDQRMQQRLADVYGNVDRIDAWVGGLAEDHAGNANMGQLFATIISKQFERLRDGDRLFYNSNELGLYKNGQLKSEIRSIIDLDQFRLADVLAANTNVRATSNPFYAPLGQSLIVNANSSEPGAEFEVIVNGQRMATFQTTTITNSFQVIVPLTESLDSIRLQFINDRYVPGESDLNLIIDSISIDDAIIETESQSVFSTGTWRASDGVVSGFGRGDTLHANGYFEFFV